MAERPPREKPKLLTSKIGAEMLGITTDYLRRMCCEGKIKAVKYGNSWVMTRAAIKHYKRTRFPQVKE